MLPGVSRSFALSLRILPRPLRTPLGITYLVARAADTLADTPAVPATDREGGLLALRAAIGGDEADGLVSLAARVAADHPAAERALLARLPEVLANRFGAWYSHGADKSVSGRIVVEGKAGRQRSRAGGMR